MMDNTTARSREPKDNDRVIWPDPSPLADWWADVMGTAHSGRDPKTSGSASQR
ncbi:hypothetical protein IU449_01820 [Nocardia higoensis]|uniref:Uncharacterized protein n=1 Tax=Nocardia higoensis TaxID=228599 RepID=A0ABS0D486_9NOCA|nr:hypothetical protein [Nocardia higoensis]MBF6353296.1 hypothetical protein [Nocardia higoensis]